MDTTEPRRGASEEVDRDPTYSPASSEHPQELPDDLPKSLDDRRSVPVFHETEMYDAWQGKRRFPQIPNAHFCSRHAGLSVLPRLVAYQSELLHDRG
jgi:hypothetical protein